MKKKKINYEDYKYVYTGYKDYCKEHNIKITSDQKLTKKEKVVKPKEQIVHDHRLQFDFNNPNQHTHDYSFDFNTQNNTTKKASTYNKKTTQATQAKPTTTATTAATRTATTTRTTQRTYAYPSNTTTTNTNTYNQTYQPAKPAKVNAGGCFVAIVVFFFIFFFMIVGIISESMDDYDYDYYSENSEEENYYANGNYSYQDAVEDYVNAIYYQDYEEVLDSVTPEEIEYNNGLKWRSSINNIINQESPIYTVSFTYTQVRGYNYQELETIEDNFNFKYNSYVEFDAGYYVSINLNINNNIIQKYFQVVKIDSYWYLISVN